MAIYNTSEKKNVFATHYERKNKKKKIWIAEASSFKIIPSLLHAQFPFIKTQQFQYLLSDYLNVQISIYVRR